MNLHDPLRPTLQHRPTYIGGTFVIQPPRVMPLPNTRYEISLMLPVKESAGFHSKWFRAELSTLELLSFLNNFLTNPEETIITIFSKDEFTPNLNPDHQFPPSTKSHSQPTLNLLPDL